MPVHSSARPTAARSPATAAPKDTICSVARRNPAAASSAPRATPSERARWICRLSRSTERAALPMSRSKEPVFASRSTVRVYRLMGSSKEKAPPDGRAFRYSGRRSYPPISTSSFRNRKVMRLPSAETLHVAPVSIIAPYPFCSCKPEPCGQENRNSPPSGPMLLADGIFAALGLADAAFIACRHIDNASAAYGPLPMHDLIPISAAIIATVSTSPARQLSPFSAMPALRRWNPDYTGTRFTATGYRGPVHIAAAPSFPKLPSAHVGQERGICRGSVCCLLRPD